MALHRETVSEDVGGKLLLLACMLAVFGGLALVLLPIGAALAPAPPAAMATAAPADTATASTEAPTPATEPASAAATPEGPPPVIGAIFPGAIMLITAAVLAALSGLLLGLAKARAEEAHTRDPATPT